MKKINNAFLLTTVTISVIVLNIMMYFGCYERDFENISDDFVASLDGEAEEEDSDGLSEAEAKDDQTGKEEDSESDEIITENIEYEFTTVDNSYFDDAAFIGDSRAVGVRLYADLGNMTYYCEQGLTVYDMFTEKLPDMEGKQVTVGEELLNKKYKKIYLEIGINEMGRGTVDSFMEQYEKCVASIMDMQPDAKIFLCSIMGVGKEKSDTDAIFNNEEIRKRNERIQELADNRNIFFLDINEYVCDEEGNLMEEYSHDQVHLLAKYDQLWVDCLTEHGIIFE